MATISDLCLFGFNINMLMLLSYQHHKNLRGLAEPCMNHIEAGLDVFVPTTTCKAFHTCDPLYLRIMSAGNQNKMRERQRSTIFAACSHSVRFLTQTSI